MARWKAYLRVFFIPAFAPKLAAVVVPCVLQDAPVQPVVRSSGHGLDRI
jgi:hypothetical protein